MKFYQCQLSSTQFTSLLQAQLPRQFGFDKTILNTSKALHTQYKHALVLSWANSSETTSFIDIRWKTTSLEEIAEMRHMERSK
jgi:hypothetical protein